MLVGINAIISSLKDFVSLAKDLKPVAIFVGGRINLNESQVRTLKLFLYSLLFTVFLMGMLLSITSMMVHLPLVGGYLNTNWVNNVSLIAKYCRDTLLLTGYLIAFLVLNIIFIYTAYKGVKNLFKAFNN